MLPDIRNPAVDASLQFFDQFSYLGKLQYLAAVAAFVPPILFWESTFVMLRYYTRMIGKWKFYVILTIPIVVIITQPTVVAPLIYSSSTSQELPVYVIILGDMLPGIVGGVIFGLPYLVVRRYLSNSGALKEAVLITAYGFIIWMLSIHMSVENAPFPPFGFVTVIAVCLSSYLILFGLSVSAKIISRNSSLRQNIRKAASYDLKFLKDIGSADMELQIEKVVRSLESKVDPYLEDVPGKILSDDEVKAYIQEIMEDLQESTKYKK